MNLPSPNPGSPRWLHLLAVLTVLFTLPLLFLGAGVTTHGVGMADPHGFRPPWVIVRILAESTGFDIRLEYGHRTFGFLVGLCAIALAIGCWFFDRRGWMGWLAFVALGMICLQGTLGIFRVDYNELYGRTFAMIHGMFAQLVFGTLVSLALFTSRRWASDGEHAMTPALQRGSIVTMLIVFVQLLLGGLVRHQESPVGPRAHLLGAFVVTGALVWLLKLIRECEAPERFRTQRWLIKGLLMLQLWLGVEAWLAKFFVATAVQQQALEPMPMHAEWLRTAHYLVGTLLFGTTVVVALVANRRALPLEQTIVAPARELEGVR